MAGKFSSSADNHNRFYYQHGVADLQPDAAIRYLYQQMNPGQKTCALLADKHTACIEGVRGLLETEFDTIFTVADADSLKEGTDRLRPTLIVVDLPVATGDFAGLIRQLRRSSPASKVIALTVHSEPAAADAMLSAGAHGVVLKRFIARDLLAAVDVARKGDRFVTPDVGPRCD